MEPDIEKYRKFVDHYDLSEEEKIEFIRTVWRIMESFADAAFGIHPVQLAKGSASDMSSDTTIDDVEFELQIDASDLSSAANSNSRKFDSKKKRK